MADFENTLANHGNALNNSSNGVNSSDATGPVRDEEKYQQARDAGWVVPQAYDYDAASARPGEQAVPSSDEQVAEHGVQTWAHQAAKYEWDDSYGDVGPEVPELEAQLFKGDTRTRIGQHLENLTSIRVTAEATERPAPILSFQDAGLHPVMLSNVEKSGYTVPTPIQAYCIPAVLKGRDVIATAQTGSGKTAAFLIPALSKLMGKVKKLAAPRPALVNGFDPARDRVRAEPLVLIVAPTRELCCQIFDDARKLCYRSMLRPCVAYGGGPIREQKDELRKGCDVLIATPGRLCDFLKDPSLLVLSRLRYTIIDEADELLHDDWQEEMASILGGGATNLDGQHQYLLFSATFDKHMRREAKRFLSQDFVRIRIGRAGSVHKNITQQIVYVDGHQKKQALYDLLISSPPARTLVFVKTKKTADFVDDFLFNNGLPTTSIHADRTQREREDSIRAFKKGTAPILIATGVSGRGLDIRNVMHVINYDLPEVEYNGQDEYIHRIGRTARIGNQGLATSFYNSRDEPMAPFLAKILVESGNTVPDFLEEYKPDEDTPLDFDDNSADEADTPEDGGMGDTGANDEAWGAGPATATPAAADDNWGSSAPAQSNINNGHWNVNTATAAVGSSW